MSNMKLINGQLVGEIEKPPKDLAKKITNFIIWGNPQGSHYDKQHIKPQAPSIGVGLERKEEEF